MLELPEARLVLRDAENVSIA
eukprot:COSAG04_NODE_17656_length_463_cov_0.708791_1_plen_20_part_10